MLQQMCVAVEDFILASCVDFAKQQNPLHISLHAAAVRVAFAAGDDVQSWCARASEHVKELHSVLLERAIMFLVKDMQFFGKSQVPFLVLTT